MAKNYYWIIFILVASVLSLFGDLAFAERPQYAPNSVTILVKKGVIDFPTKEGKRTVLIEKATILSGSLNEFLSNLKARSLTKIFSNSIPDDTLRGLKDGSQIRLKDLSGYYGVSFDSSIDVFAVVESLRTFPEVTYAEPNWLYYLNVIPNDPVYHLQWHLGGYYGIHAPSAWDITTGSTSTKIAVVDGGVDYNHEDLVGKRYGGWDYGDDDYDPMDDMQEGEGDNYFGNHGTPVAGIIGAVTNNYTGVSGVDWNCKIMPMKVAGTHQILVWDLDLMFEWDAAAGIIGAIDDGADVINMSFGSYILWYNEIIEQNVLYSACYNAYQLGAVLVAAAGNENTSDPCRPAAFPCVMGIGAINAIGDKTDFSNYGDYIDVVAPGLDIYTISRYDEYCIFGGTSASAPVVSGVAGLLLAKNPDLTNEDVRRVLEISAQDDPINPGWDPYLGYGIVNADSALKLLDSHDLSHMTAQGGSAQMTWGSHQHAFLNNGGLATGTYFGVEQWKVTKQVDYSCLGLQDVPFVWPRMRGTVGWSGANPNLELNWAYVIPGSVTQTGCSIETFVYFIKYNLLGQEVNEWWCNGQAQNRLFDGSGLERFTSLDLS